MMICHDFKLANHAANDRLQHKDGIHMSEAGTHKLLQNLNVVSEPNIPSDDVNLHLDIPITLPKTFSVREVYPAVDGIQLGAASVENSHNISKDLEIADPADRTNT